MPNQPHRIPAGQLASESNFPMQSIASYLLAAIDTVAGTFGSPEIGLLILGLLAGLISAPFSYTGRRALEPVQSLAPQIQSLRARHGDDRRSLQRALLELYQQHAINPWAPLLGLIPAAIEVLLVVLLYLVSARRTRCQRLPISVGSRTCRRAIHFSFLPAQWVCFSSFRLRPTSGQTRRGRIGSSSFCRSPYPPPNS